MSMIMPGMTLYFSYDRVLYNSIILNRANMATTLITRATSMLVVALTHPDAVDDRACLVITQEGGLGWIRCTCWDETNTPEGGR